jgi:hypothetical protein
MKRRDPGAQEVAYGVPCFPFSDALPFLIDRKRKRFLACARNDMREKIAPHSLSYRRRFQPTKTARQNKKNQLFA